MTASGLAAVAAALALLLSACGGSPQPDARTPRETPVAAREPPASPAGRGTLDEGDFAFADTSGRELLALDSLAEPARLRFAICARAAVYPVAFARRQVPRAEGSGRQSARDFGNEGGAVFRVVSGAVPEDATCYLTADSALAASAAAAGPGGGEECGAGVARRAAQAKGRAVQDCRPFATTPSGAEIDAVRFATVDTSALASLVLADSVRLLFADFPARYSGPDQDVWRVDDGGKFPTEGFDILFLGRRGGHAVVGLTWMGSEGQDAFLFVADSADALRVVTMSYRYLAPN